MTRPVMKCGEQGVACALCDYITEATWADEAVGELRGHVRSAHGLEMTDHEADAVLRGELEKSQAA